MVVSLLRQVGYDRGEGAAGWPARPQGGLLWAHLGAEVDPRGLSLALAGLRRSHPGLTILATGKVGLRGVDQESSTPRGAFATRRFLDHWRPNAVLWSGSDAHPALWSEIVSHEVPAIAVEIDPARHPWRAVRALGGFGKVFSVTPDPRFEGHVVATGRLCVAPDPPKPRPGDFEALRERLETRPLWYAADVPQDEIGGVLSAQARAAQLSHRLLLFLRPVNDVVPRAALDAGGWRWALRSEVSEPDADTQILVADEAGEEALWLRLAPLTYLGGTLMGQGPGTSPLLPAGLGSAVVHGDTFGAHEDALSRLQQAGASYRIDSFDALGRAVDELQSPDRVATLAHSAWHITSEGADASAALQDALDAVLADASV